MKEQLISLEAAKLAKEKGFDLPVIYFYDYYNYSAPIGLDLEEHSGDPFELIDNHNRSQNYSAPSQTLLQKWLRETHNIDVIVSRDSEVHYNDEVRWNVCISDWNDIKEVKYSIAVLRHPNHWHLNDFKSYEEAMEAGLIDALKIS